MIRWLRSVLFPGSARAGKPGRQPESVFILSLDSGGIRGLIPARVLLSLEERLRTLGCTTAIGDLFHLIAGTSTGALIAFGLAMPEKSNRTDMKRLCNLYRKLGHTVFPPDRFFSLRTMRQAFTEKYNAEPFERLLKATFGDCTLKDCRTNLLVCSYDTVRRKPHLFKNRLDRSIEDPNFFLRDAARASAAAPTFFKPALIQDIPYDEQPARDYCLIDGAVFADNPAMAAYIEARKIYPGAGRYILVSLGTGQQQGAYRYEDIKSWGYMDWVSPMRNVPLFTIMNDGQSAMTSHQLTKLPGVEFYRIDLPLPPEVSEDMDNSSKENMAAIEEFSSQVIDAFSDQLDTIARLLADR
ncbi:patatin-like phospholipase family protein [Spirochaeta dissipatitropha]